MSLLTSNPIEAGALPSEGRNEHMECNDNNFSGVIPAESEYQRYNAELDCQDLATEMNVRL